MGCPSTLKLKKNPTGGNLLSQIICLRRNRRRHGVRLDDARHYLSLFLGELSERQIIAKISEILSDHEMTIIHRIVMSQEMLGELARRNGFRATDGSQKNDP